MQINDHAKCLSSDQSLLDQLDERYSWHPFSQASERKTFPPIHIKSGKGCWLEDEEGNRLLDGYASCWTNVHGHRCQELDDAIRAQVDRVSHSTYLGLSSEPASRVAKKLSGYSGNRLTRTFFTETGACAVEVAIKQSLRFWQLSGQKERKELISMSGGYHGDTFATMSLSDESPFTSPWKEWALPVSRFKAPTHVELGGEVSCSEQEESLQDLKRILSERQGEVACVILEPSVQGVAGMTQQPEGFLNEVSNLCREEGCHLILDEIFVGFGRLGEVLVGESKGCEADFICVGKGLSGGYLPLAACLTGEEIFEAFSGAFSEHRTFYHGHTFTANPLAASVSLASLNLLETKISKNDLNPRIKWFGKCIRKHFLEHPRVRAVRQRGFTACLDLQAQPGERLSPKQRFARSVCIEARKNGVLIRPLGNSIPLVPPVCISNDEIDLLCLQTRKSLDLVNL